MRMCVCTLHMVGHRDRAGENDVAKTWLLFSHHGPHHSCLMHGAWNSLVPSQSPDRESNHPSVLLTHKLLWSGAFALSHICRELLYDSRSLKRHQRNIVIHNRLLFLTIFHGRYYRKPYRKAIWWFLQHLRDTDKHAILICVIYVI